MAQQGFLDNYPDILGSITGGRRCNIGVAQVALAVRPRVVRAGRPFEVMLLVQNASDVSVDVTTTLLLPEVDAKKQRSRFVGKKTRLVVGMGPAEIGCVLLPATCLADTAVSDGYKVGVEVEVKPMSKPRRVRHADGGTPVNYQDLTDASVERIEELKGLTFWTTKRLGLGRTIVEAPFSVMPGRIGQIVDFTPGWVSVAALSDFKDNRYLLHLYGDRLKLTALPQFKRSLLFAPLLEATSTHFKQAGYPLHEAEAILIAKLLMLILEYSMPKETAHGYVAAGRYGITPLLERDLQSLDEPPELPDWCLHLLRAIDRDERAIERAGQMIVRYLYLHLLRDGIRHGFELVLNATGEDLGSPQELEEYGDTVLSMFETKQGMDFSHVYLPLLMGGILVHERLPLSKEDPSELLTSATAALEQRRPECSEEDLPIYDITSRLLEGAGQKYGLQLS
jgi:hypothetical protein